MGSHEEGDRASRVAGEATDGSSRAPRAPRVSEWSPSKKVGVTLLVLLSSLLAGWAALEVALRLAGGPGEVVAIFPDFHRGDARLGWAGQPDVALRFRREGFDVLVEHGPDGFRRPDPEPPADAPRRVLVLGDSLAWGWGIGRGDLLTDELQRRVGPAVAVENRALCSFGTAQEMLLMEDLLARRHYDAVILVYSRTDPVNDVDGNALRPAFRFARGRLAQVRHPPPGTSDRPLAGWLRRNSLAWRFVEGRGRELLRKGKAGSREVDGAPAAPPQADFRRLPGHDLVRELLREMKRIAAAHGAEFVVAYEPHHVFPAGAPEAATRAARDLVVDACRRAGIPFVDVGEGFVDHRGETIFPDGHWTPAGHRAVAAALLASPVSRAAILGEASATTELPDHAASGLVPTVPSAPATVAR